MLEIKTFDFNEEGLRNIEKYKYGLNWPVVYIINNKDEIYVGETLKPSLRIYKHLKDKRRKNLETIKLITSAYFNKSVALDLEAFLIKYIAGDGKFKLQNGNNGIQSHDYYEKEKYEAEFTILWNMLKKEKIVKKDLLAIENSDLFKYSPYKSLNMEQYMVVGDIVEVLKQEIENGEKSSIFVEGVQGSGKSVVGMYLIKLLLELSTQDKYYDEDDEKDNELLIKTKFDRELKIGYVVAVSPLRATIKKVFKLTNGLDSNLVLSPFSVASEEFDILIVDEAQRLNRRNCLSSPSQYVLFDEINTKLGFDENGTQLDWVLKQSKHQIFLYHHDQGIKSSDVLKEDFDKIKKQKTTHIYNLNEQMRCLGGNDYIKYVYKVFSNKPPKQRLSFGTYDFKLFNNVKQMTDLIIEKNSQYGLCRNLAGYAWKWSTKGMNYTSIVRKNLYDIDIQGFRYIWNTGSGDWINSIHSIDEIGCIHKVSGYDLNYAGVIIGNDLKYDKENKKLIVDSKNYFDTNGKMKMDDKELINSIIRIYKILLTRGIKGTYLYVCDDNLREYLSNYIEVVEDSEVFV